MSTRAFWRSKGRSASRKPWLGAAVVMAVLAISACGGSGSGSSEPSGGDDNTSSTSGGGATASDGGGGLATVAVSSNSNIGVLPLWVAMDEGIAKKHGLNIKFTMVDNVGVLPPQLGKTFDIGLVTPAAAIQSTAKGIPVTEVAGAYNDTADNPDSALMVAKDSAITKLSQLKGKTIGALTVQGTLNYATIHMLKKAGVPQNSVKIINVNGPQAAAQLRAGRIDAMETVNPFTYQIKKNGGNVLGIPFKSLADTISVIWWGANPTWASQHANVVEKFRQTLADGIKFINNNESQARIILQKYTKLPEKLTKEMPLPSYDVSVRPQDIPKWIDLLKEVAGFKGNVDAKDFAFQP